MNKKYLDSDGLLYLWGKIKSALTGKVDKAEGMGLSSNDFTTPEKAKLEALKNYEIGTGLTVTGNVLSATGGGTADSVEWDNVQNKPELALKSDLSSVYRYKGSVTNYASLPTENNTEGDVWNVEASGMNYAWTGTAWDALGETFQIESITNAEIDTIVTGE